MATVGATVQASDPLPRRVRAYFAERFPLLAHGILILSYYSSNQFLAQVLAHPDRPIHYGPHSLMGGLAVFCVFLHLRVFDEHKDYAEDCVHHPDRLLSRGVITLRELRILGAAAIACELLMATLRGPAAVVGTLLVLGFSLLMLREFFVAEWLKRHFLLYTLSHMLIMPLLALMVYSFTTKRLPWTAPPLFVLYAFVGFFVTLNWEISRKIRAPQDERQGLDSYSKIFGPMGAAAMVLAVRVIDTGMVAVVGWHLGLSVWFYGVLAALFLVCLTGFVQFRAHPSAKTAKRLESYAGFYIVAFDITLAVEILRTHPVVWWG